METCILCNDALGNGKEHALLTAKGADTINIASNERGDNIFAYPGLHVHTMCRSKYTNPKTLQMIKKHTANTTKNETPPQLRSESTFNFKIDCIFCGKTTELKRFDEKTEVHCVRTDEFTETIADICKQRRDSWRDDVVARIEYAQDLHASDTVYHGQCSTNFRTFKQVPTIYRDIVHDDSINPNKRGRPSDAVREDAFFFVTQYLEENDDEQITVNDLRNVMRDALMDIGNEPYSFPHMKKKLTEHFKDRIIITDLNGRSNVVTFKTTASVILHQLYSQSQLTDTDLETIRLTETVAKLVKSDIKDIITDGETYPSSDQMKSVEENVEFLPQSLKLLLQSIFMGKDSHTKVASIGQAIMQAARPRVITAPLQIGLGVQMHRQYGSRFLIDSLHKHGFCSSYQEIQKYERSAAVNLGTEIPGYIPGRFVQHVADHVDHNLTTLDGNNTFHGMGIITSVTPETEIHKAVPKVTVTPRTLQL